MNYDILAAAAMPRHDVMTCYFPGKWKSHHNGAEPGQVKRKSGHHGQASRPHSDAVSWDAHRVAEIAGYAYKTLGIHHISHSRRVVLEGRIHVPGRPHGEKKIMTSCRPASPRPKENNDVMEPRPPARKGIMTSWLAAGCGCVP